MFDPETKGGVTPVFLRSVCQLTWFLAVSEKGAEGGERQEADRWRGEESRHGKTEGKKR